MTDSAPSTPRIVPGAPPPSAASKSQKKRRRPGKAGEKPEDSPAVGSVSIPDTTAAALTESAPAPTDIETGAVADELVAHPPVNGNATPAAVEEALPSDGQKISPVVEIIQKRLKNTAKKISRIAGYAAGDPSKLNEDQRRNIATLPVLEAVAKELEELKKLVETHEAEVAKDRQAQLAEAEKAEAARVAAAVVDVQSRSIEQAATMLAFLRMQGALRARDPSIEPLQIDEPTAAAIHGVSHILFTDAGADQRALITGLMTGEGDFQGVSHSRFLDLTREFLTPNVVPTFVAAEEAAPEPETVVLEVAVEEPEAPAAAIPSALPTTISFIQDSELEQSLSQSESQEWVQVGSEESPVAERAEETPVEEVTVEVEVQIPIEQPVSGGAFDWADEDEGELPEISGLHAKFGTSGEATPAETSTPAPEPAAPEPAPPVEVAPETPPTVNTSGPLVDDDGFVMAGGRTRGRARGFDDRGRGRGGYRGGERGGYRGGERGGYRGGDRGGFRGNFRGERGERGGYRSGRGDGEWRGGSGDGEWRARGRGRGRGRGGFQERGGAPPPPTAAPIS